MLLRQIEEQLVSYDDTLSTMDISRLIGKHPETIRRLIYSGKLRGEKCGKGYIYAKRWLLAYVEKYGVRDSYEERMEKTLSDVVDFCVNPRTIHEIVAFSGYCNKSYTMRMITRPLLKEKRLQLTIPESPHHNNQRYVSVPRQCKQFKQ